MDKYTHSALAVVQGHILSLASSVHFVYETRHLAHLFSNMHQRWIHCARIYWPSSCSHQYCQSGQIISSLCVFAVGWQVFFLWGGRAAYGNCGVGMVGDGGVMSCCNNKQILMIYYKSAAEASAWGDWGGWQLLTHTPHKCLADDVCVLQIINHWVLTHTHAHTFAKNMLSTHVRRCTGSRTHTRVATHMFLVANASSVVAGDKSITGTEVQGGKRLSGPFFPMLLIPFYWHHRQAVSRTPGKRWIESGWLREEVGWHSL